MAWDVEITDQTTEWYRSLTEDEQDAVEVAVQMLEAHRPGLGRPWVDSIKGSRVHNLKELRPKAGSIRILFVFDPRRMAILLVGGDKTDQWDEWYRDNVPVAERLYDEHLTEIGRPRRRRT